MENPRQSPIRRATDTAAPGLPRFATLGGATVALHPAGRGLFHWACGCGEAPYESLTFVCARQAANDHAGQCRAVGQRRWEHQVMTVTGGTDALGTALDLAGAIGYELVTCQTDMDDCRSWVIVLKRPAGAS